MPWKQIAPVLALAACAALAVVPVFAQQALAQQTSAQQTPRGNETLKKYCTGDYLSYCGQYNRDDPRLDACFKENWKKLSENCRRAIDAYAPPGSTPSRKKG